MRFHSIEQTENLDSGRKSTIIVFKRIALLSVIMAALGSSPAKSCDPNERLVTDTTGSSYLELRWAIGTPTNLIKLKIPAEYISGANTGCIPETYLGYPDPNYTSPSAQDFAIALSLPDFVPFRKADPRNFKNGLDWSAMEVLIESTVKTINDGDAEQKLLDFSTDLYLSNSNISLKKSGLHGGRKPNLFGLNRVGTIGDVSIYQNNFGGNEAVDFYFPDSKPVDFWIQCQASGIKDHTEDPAWSRRPPCTMYFRNQTLSAALHVEFPRIFLYMWPKIKQNVEIVIGTFQIQTLDAGNL